MQGVRGGEHLLAQPRETQAQGVRGGEHLPAPAPDEHMQGVRGVGHLPAPAPEEQECREEADESMPDGLEELEEAGV